MWVLRFIGLSAPATTRGEANMQIKKIGGLPCLVNNRNVDAGTALLRNPYPHVLEKEKLDKEKLQQRTTIYKK